MEFAELSKNCRSINDLYFCEDSNLVDLRISDNCLMGLFNEEAKKIKELCPFLFEPKSDFVTQISPNVFLLYQSEPSAIDVHCVGSSNSYQIYPFHGVKEIIVHGGCVAKSSSFILSGSYEIYSTMQSESLKTLPFNFSYVMGRGTEEVGRIVADLELVGKKSATTFAHVEEWHRTHQYNSSKTLGISISMLIIILIVGFLLFLKCKACKNGYQGVQQQAGLLLGLQQLPAAAPVPNIMPGPIK